MSAAHETCAANNRSHADPMKRSPEAKATAGADPQPPPLDSVAETPDPSRPVPQPAAAPARLNWFLRRLCCGELFNLKLLAFHVSRRLI